MHLRLIVFNLYNLNKRRRDNNLEGVEDTYSTHEQYQFNCLKTIPAFTCNFYVNINCLCVSVCILGKLQAMPRVNIMAHG